MLWFFSSVLRTASPCLVHLYWIMSLDCCRHWNMALKRGLEQTETDLICQPPRLHWLLHETSLADGTSFFPQTYILPLFNQSLSNCNWKKSTLMNVMYRWRWLFKSHAFSSDSWSQRTLGRTASIPDWLSASGQQPEPGLIVHSFHWPAIAACFQQLSGGLISNCMASCQVVYHWDS